MNGKTVDQFVLEEVMRSSDDSIAHKNATVKAFEDA